MIFTRWLRWGFARPQKVVKFVSYPKTGNTWVRVLLGRYFQLLWSLDRLLLLEEAEKDIFAAHRIPALDVSHGVLEWTSQTADDLTYANVVEPYVDIPVIMLVRDPLDTLLSLFMHTTYQSKSEGTARRATTRFAHFVNDPVMRLDKFVRFHNLWIGKPRLLLSRYEDMRNDIERQIARMVEFIGAPVDRSNLQKAIEFASFENMKAMELSEDAPRYKSSGFRIFATGDPGEPNAFHVREGRIAAHYDHLTAAQRVEFLTRILRNLACTFGYNGPTAAKLSPD